VESRWVGRVLRDKWRIDRRIARGGVGTVFAATHKNNGSTAAIKILHAGLSRDKDTRSRFLQEGYAANQVNHPGVVRILDDDVTEEGLAYLVMELLEGELLEQRRIRKGGRLPIEEVYDVADQLLDVLAAAHAKGVVHRDVKPDNIFLTKQGRLKVLDFGFAQMKSGFRTEQTATGFLLGTPGFMAPEQAVGDRPLIDAQTDVWSVGATLFILLTGQPVHDGESAAEMLVAAANYPARSISTLEPRLPTKLMAAVDRALAFQKSERWPDARSMQNALRNMPGRPPVVSAAPGRSKWVNSLHDDEPHPALADDTTLMDHVEELNSDHLIAGPGESVYLQAGDESTMPMEERPRRDPGERPGDRAPFGGPDVPGLGLSQPDGFAQPQSPAGSFPAAAALGVDPRSAPTARSGARVPSTGSRVLVFFLVAGSTMVVVILLGLLVILGME
jgi:serine/threonine-protein kinase